MITANSITPSDMHNILTIDTYIARIATFGSIASYSSLMDEAVRPVTSWLLVTVLHDFTFYNAPAKYCDLYVPFRGIINYDCFVFILLYIDIVIAPSIMKTKQ